MSERVHGDAPRPPEFNGNVPQWIREVRRWLETQSRRTEEEINNLHNIKADA